MARRVEELYAVGPLTDALLLSRTVMVIEDNVTGSLKVAVTSVEVATSVAPDAGVRAVMVGGVLSAGGAAAVVKLQLTWSIGLLAVSVAPETVAV